MKFGQFSLQLLHTQCKLLFFSFQLMFLSVQLISLSAQMMFLNVQLVWLLKGVVMLTLAVASFLLYNIFLTSLATDAGRACLQLWQILWTFSWNWESHTSSKFALQVMATYYTLQCDTWKEVDKSDITLEFKHDHVSRFESSSYTVYKPNSKA